MMFRTVKNAIVQLLGDYAESRFRVVGYLRQSKSSDVIKNNDRLVQVYYADGNLPETSRRTGYKTHNMNFKIDLSASAAASADLSILDNPSATSIQKAAALAMVQESADIADQKIDELIEYVFQILLDARNQNLNLGVGEVTSRWIDTITKDTIISHGDLIVKTASINYKCRVQELVLGDIGTEPETVVYDATVTVGETDGAGTLTENEN